MHKPILKIRPIVSTHSTITYFASKYLHNVLNELVKKIPTICLNSLEIIKELSDRNLPKSACILCADIQEMYPSIPLEYGLKAVRSIMIQFNFEPDKQEFILDLLEWILNNNYVSFDNSIYHQTKGTAMGTPVAVCYANITIFYLEQSCFTITNPIIYKRFIDDLCVICFDTYQAQLIITTFNQQHPSIQLTAITIDTQGIFLDIKLSIDPISNTINFNLYQKDTNKYLYLPPWSAHNRHILINIIKNEIRRIIILNSLRIDAVLDIKKFRQRLLNRGFSNHFLNPLFDSHNIPHRPILLSTININRNNHNNTDITINNNINIHNKEVNCGICNNNNLNDNLNNNLNNNNNNNNKDNKSKIFNKRPFIITHLPKFPQLLLNEIFKLPSSITNHPSYKKVYDSQYPIQIINSTTHNSINMYLNHKKR